MPRADLRIEAWAPTREACIAEAVGALVEGFLRGPLPRASSTACFEVSGSTDAELLVAVLRKVISRIRDLHEIPALTEVVATSTGLCVRCEMVDSAAVVPAGPIPKGVSRQPVRCERTAKGWWCTARINV